MRLFVTVVYSLFTEREPKFEYRRDNFDSDLISLILKNALENYLFNSEKFIRKLFI
jgi:hypothetical protein